ncbi:MAG: presenilin family intramembrane aspartyl protease PSH [Halococcoides sp.]
MIDRRVVVAAGGIAAIFLAVQIGALALVEPFREAGLQAVEDPQDPTNSLLYIGLLLVVTALMLLAIRYDLTWVIRVVVVATGAYFAWLVLDAFAGLLGVPALIASGGGGVIALAIAGGLWVHPEWYVIDAAGVVMGAGAAGLFGISFGVLPAIVLLAALAVYDAISVYRTEHMLTLAEGVMDLRIPVVLVIPIERGYSFLDDGPTVGSADDATEDGEATGAEAGEGGPAATAGDETPDAAEEDPLDRGALFIGLGDAVMPTVLVASAVAFTPGGVDISTLAGIPLTVPALGAIVGTMVGLAALVRMVLAGRAHAGLPLLNGGAIAGYLIASVAIGVDLLVALGLASG